MYKVIVFLYLGFSLFVFADSSTNDIQADKIKTLIMQVKNAKSSDRHLLMNKLKVTLRKSNQAQRVQVMKELRKSFSTSHTSQNKHLKREHRYQPSYNGKQQPKLRLRQNDNKGNNTGYRVGGGNRPQ